MNRHVRLNPAQEARALSTPSPPLPWRLRYLRDGLGTVLGAMGIQGATAAARLVARGIFALQPRTREHVESNLAQAYGPALSREACVILARRVFENVARFWIEVLYCRRRLAPAAWQRCVHLNPPAAWKDLARQTHPLVLVTGYLGNPAVAACALSAMMPPVHALIDPAARMLIEASRGAARRFRGLRLINRPEARCRIPKLLQQGGRLLMLAGPTHEKRGGISATFLGRQGCWHATIARLARRHGAEIVVFACRRTEREAFRFELSILDRIRPEPKSATASRITQRYLSALERAVREYPAQYLWTRV